MVERWVKISLALITISLIVHWILFIIMMEKLNEPVTLMRLEEAKNIPDEIKDVYKNTFVPKLNALETLIFDKLEEGVVYANDDEDDEDDEDKVQRVPAKKAAQIIADNMKNNIDNKFCEISMGEVGGEICACGNLKPIFPFKTCYLNNKEDICANTWGADNGDHWEDVKYKFKSPFCGKLGLAQPGGVNPCNPKGFCWGPICASDIDGLADLIASDPNAPKWLPFFVKVVGFTFPENTHHLLFACRENGNVSS